MRHLKWLGALALALLLLNRPEAAALGAAQAMARWYASVAPAMLPFLTLMPLLTCREAAQAYEALLGRAMKVLFNLPGAAAPAMVISMIAGSPAGTLAARNVAARSGMNRGQLRRLAVAVAGFSPAFLVGGIGVGMLGSAALGWKLFQAQLLTQLAMAMLFRRAWRGETESVEEAAWTGREQPVRAAVLTVLTVCGYMAVFGAASFAIRASVGRGVADGLLCLMDVPSGAGLVSALPIAQEVRLVLIAMLCGFGGLCVTAQNLSALKNCGIGVPWYVGMRLLSAAISGGCMALLLIEPATGLANITGHAVQNPLAVGALAAIILSIPVLINLQKSLLTIVFFHLAETLRRKTPDIVDKKKYKHKFSVFSQKKMLDISNLI